MCKDKNISEQVAQFVIFAIEEYREAKKLNGKCAIALFETSGLLDYIEEFYDVLHPQGSEYLISDFDDFLSTKTII